MHVLLFHESPDVVDYILETAVVVRPSAGRSPSVVLPSQIDLAPAPAKRTQVERRRARRWAMRFAAATNQATLN